MTHIVSSFARSTLQRNMGDEVTIRANPAYEAVEFDGETFTKCRRALFYSFVLNAHAHFLLMVCSWQRY